MNSFIDSPLGKAQSYVNTYSPQLLYPIARKIKRDELLIPTQLPFHGVDIWNAYEVSWLNTKGKPVIAMVEIIIPCDSTHIVESKSLKLYLNSFNQSSFQGIGQVKELIIQDISNAVGGAVKVKFITQPETSRPEFQNFYGTCLDDLDIECNVYTPQPSFLEANGEIVEETLHSHLLKSNCLVTGQPDWASILIKYQGKQIHHPGLLKYLVSFRNHCEFHEQCVERIFTDIIRHCEPKLLTVYARYTRRGGIDINPFRSNFEASPENMRVVRQ